MLDPSPIREKRLIWISAVIIALSLHAALAAFAVSNYREPDALELGAPGIEIGIEVASPRRQPTDLPPGPDSEASIASPRAVQQEQTQQSDLPQDIPTETDEPDRIVTESRSNKPEEQTPETPTQPTAPSEASVAQEATAIPSIEEAREAPTSITRDPGSGRSEQRVRTSWQRELLAHLDKHKRYPPDRSGKSVDVSLNLVLDRNGKVVSATVLKGSGDRAFDEAALDMVKRADPVPAPPALIADDGLSFVLPVAFAARR